LKQVDFNGEFENSDVVAVNILDDFYDLLSLEDARLSDANTATEEDIEAVGVYIQLQNGEQTIAQVDLLIMNRILEVISMDEFNDFIEAIVSSVEKPNDAAICQKTLL
jgi:hypothetical protein